MKSILITAAIASVLGSGASFADQGDWLIRGRLLSVAPNESASINPIGGDVDIDTSFVPELDISYFFTERFAVELILGVTPHDVMAIGTAAGNVDLGEVTLLPPTLTVQYHFRPEGTIHPYVGAGINYTVFFNENLAAGSIATAIDYDNSFGLALQGGIDFDVNENWFFNVDVKYIDINTDVTINNAITADVDIDPWVFGIGIGRRF
ncbi:OmpW family protein [Hyphobacterium sp. CCMP332]|uniref:OmpW/AlkL family protein n=1 Tax=Hyphobacterium sp. CCMP332 TaxID=2749086 RepID=UPI0016506E1C|nr:OmpW family protein [Hyphobacterium sp. CCMP332]QNL19343.1 OmpW family protein [Hyphobacterium sp. CCMP332]